MHRHIYFPVIATAVMIFAGTVVAGPIQVQNDKKITENMSGMVFLTVVGSNPKCSYTASLDQLRPGTPKAQWVLKAKNRTCTGAKDMSIKITNAQALVILDQLPIPAMSTLNLYDRSTE